MSSSSAPYTLLAPQLSQAQIEQAKLQLEQAKTQREVEIEQMRAQMDAQKMEFERQKAEMEEQYNRWKTELDAATKVTVARISANPGQDLQLLQAANAASERMTAELGDNVVAAVQQVANLHEDMANKANATMDNIASMIQTLNAPKRIIRGPDGKAIGVEIAV